jgi:hypothetical protein
VTGTQADGAGPVPDPKPDILSGTLHPAPARAPQAPGEPETAGQQAQAPDGTGHLPAPDAQQDPRPEPAGRASRSRRWIPDLIRRRGQQPQTGATEDDGADTAPATEGLAYLLVVGDESCRDEAALNRSRSALLEVDKKIGELPGFAYQVRMLHGDEDGLRGDLREAGQLGRRDIKRTVAGVDFAAALEGVRASLRRDRAPLKAAASTRPAVVFFTPEPPLADAAAADLLRDLAREALIVWALPRSSKGLLSAAFTDAPGVQVVMADHGVADEIATLLISGADTMKANA